MTDPLKAFEESLTGGLAHRKWHYITRSTAALPAEYNDNDWPERMAVLFLMDAEYDLVRITYCDEGLVRINSDGHSYFLFSGQQLNYIASMINEAQAQVEKWLDGKPSKATKGWGKYIPEDDE